MATSKNHRKKPKDVDNGYKAKGGEEMQLGFFSEENRMEKLSKLGDSLVRLNNVIN